MLNGVVIVVDNDDVCESNVKAFFVRVAIHDFGSVDLRISGMPMQ